MKLARLLKTIFMIDFAAGLIIAVKEVFKSKKTAKIAMANLKRKYRKYWCVITKTI